jgi:DNA repair protein RadC
MKVNEVKVQYSKKIVGKVPNVQSAVDYCKSIPEFENRMEYQEVFAAVYIDTGNNILCHQIIGIGSISGAMADIRIIMSTALKTLATKILLCHNHPSGNLKPSDADIKLTKEIKNAALFFNIQVIDHIILSKESYYSFADNCIL